MTVMLSVSIFRVSYTYKQTSAVKWAVRAYLPCMKPTFDKELACLDKGWDYILQYILLMLMFCLTSCIVSLYLFYAALWFHTRWQARWISPFSLTLSHSPLCGSCCLLAAAVVQQVLHLSAKRKKIICLASKHYT